SQRVFLSESKPSTSSKIRKYSVRIPAERASLKARSINHKRITRRFGLRGLREMKLPMNTFVSMTTASRRRFVMVYVLLRRGDATRARFRRHLFRAIRFVAP